MYTRNRVEEVTFVALLIFATESSKGAFASGIVRVVPGSKSAALPSEAVNPAKKATEGSNLAVISGTIPEETNPALKSAIETSCALLPCDLTEDVRMKETQAILRKERIMNGQVGSDKC
jgi:hypothetical protein